jgi:DNA/RNA endonuclease G (NUC1)
MPNLSELAFSTENLLKCKGYDPKFIDNKVNIDPVKVLTSDLKGLLPTVEGNDKGILHYTGLSVLYNTKRRVPFFAAYNIDGKLKTDTETRPKFRNDPRMKAEQQLGFPFYDLRMDITEFEIGHMASNKEMGRGKDGKLRAYQTFHFTNSVPQAEKLNTGIWKGLEGYIISEAATLKNNKRICVFTGPLLKSNDPKYLEDKSFRIPLLFFKVIVFPTDKGLFSTAFLMSHEKKMIEDGMIDTGPQALAEGPFADFKYKKVFQVNISLLEKESGLKFSWPGVKRVQIPDVKNQIKKIKSIKDAKEAAAALKNSSIESLSNIKQHQEEAATRSIKKGLVPEALLSNAELTSKELKHKKFRLNMVLPQ